MTVGTQILLCHGFNVAAGVSFPLTGGSVRQTEYLLSFSYNF